MAQAHPGLELSLIDLHPVEALPALRHGEIDVALIFRYAATYGEPPDPPATTALIQAIHDSAR